MQRLSSVLFVAIVAIAGNVSLAQEESREKKGLDAAVEAWVRHFNNHDATALSKEFTEDTDVHYLPNDQLKGRAAIEEFYVEYFSKNPKVKTKLADVTRRILAPGVALVDGIWEERGHTEEGLPTKGSYSTILVKRGDRWIILHDRAWPAPKDGE